MHTAVGGIRASALQCVLNRSRVRDLPDRPPRCGTPMRRGNPRLQHDQKPVKHAVKTRRKKQGQYSESSRVSFAAATTWFSGWFSARAAGALVDGGTTRDGDAAKRTANRQGGAGEGGVLAVCPERHQQAQQGQRARSNCALRFVSLLRPTPCTGDALTVVQRCCCAGASQLGQQSHSSSSSNSPARAQNA